MPSPPPSRCQSQPLRREVWAWALYDVANSGYTTVVITTLYSAYFVAAIAQSAPWATLAWTGALAVSYLIIMVVAPWIGHEADQRGHRKRWLFGATFGCIAGTLALSATGPADIALALAALIVSNLCFAAGESLIAAYLPELASPEKLGRISGFGWGLGYLGGLITLGLCLVWISHTEARGSGPDAFIPGTLWITAAVFALASLPAFLWLRERPPQITPASPVHFSDGWRLLRSLPELRWFLACVLTYQAGVQTVIALAAIYAQEAMGFTPRQTLTLVLAVNLAAAVGALAFGFVQDRIGHRRAIALALAGWLLTSMLAAMAQEHALFWLAAHCAGLCMGASQSAGRALVGALAPEGHHSACFGLWGAAVKAASACGPLAYGLTSWLTNDHRQAMLVTSLWFVAGLFLLARVDIAAGTRRAKNIQPPEASGSS